MLLAAGNGHTEVVQCLLEHGADWDAADEVRCDRCIAEGLVVMVATTGCA